MGKTYSNFYTDMRFFGDKEVFAIGFRPYERFADDHAIAYCHFILGGHLIGDMEEPCLLSTWICLVEDLRNDVEINKGHLFNQLFAGLSEREIFELIFKSNQLEEQFDFTFDYLPAQPTNELWVKHRVALDETIDAYKIIVIEDAGKLKFIWKGWRDPCPPNQIDQLYSAAVEHNLFNSTVDSCLSFLRASYPGI